MCSKRQPYQVSQAWAQWWSKSARSCGWERLWTISTETGAHSNKSFINCTKKAVFWGSTEAILLLYYKDLCLDSETLSPTNSLLNFLTPKSPPKISASPSRLLQPRLLQHFFEFFWLQLTLWKPSCKWRENKVLKFLAKKSSEPVLRVFSMERWLPPRQLSWATIPGSTHLTSSIMLFLSTKRGHRTWLEEPSLALCALLSQTQFQTQWESSRPQSRLFRQK